jgi:LPS-assembly lipoprotein
MSSCNRRAALALLLLPLVAGCGFAPVYGPGGSGAGLPGQVAVDAPTDRNGYLLVSRLEERLGRSAAPAYRLSYRITTDSDGLGSTSDGRTTRYHLLASVSYSLRDAGSDTELLAGTTETYTGYSATGSTAATQAALRDAELRLMTILADQIVDRLLTGLDGAGA